MSKEIRKHIDSFRTFILKENSTPEYDEILDLYSEVGLENMSEDEIDFLKSGGQTKLPRRISSRNSQKEYDDFVKNKNLDIKNLTTEEWQDINDLKKIINDCQDVKITYDYEGVGFYLDLMCNLNFIYTKDTFNSLKTLNNQFNLSQENGKIIYSVPKSWLKHLNLF
jgi:hypothetical protein